MQLSCPTCHQHVSSQNINIQRLVAVCPHCDTVFQFDPERAKAKKRRKVKQPDRITISEAKDRFSIAFRTNFRLEQNQDFLASAFLSGIFTFVTLILFSEYLAGQAPLFVPISMSVFVASMYYWLALLVYNKTQIDVDEEKISVFRTPLPNALSSPTTVSLSGIESIRYSETAVSKREGYDTPRYQVWAEMIDGHRKPILNDVIEEYAVFLAQRLNEYLDLSADLNADAIAEPEIERLHLTDDEDQTDTDNAYFDDASFSQKKR